MVWQREILVGKAEESNRFAAKVTEEKRDRQDPGAELVQPGPPATLRIEVEPPA